MSNIIRIATRKSKLALWQAHHVADRLQAKGFATELVLVVTKGDRILDIPLAEIGGKGLFLKEIEDTLLRNEADIAVHSMKDVPSHMPDGLCLAAMLQREDPSDALVGADSLESLPTNAIVGTASLRRHAQLIAARPDLKIKTLRGNVNTRLQKLLDGEYDAIVLATAGLKRLELEHHIGQRISKTAMLPAVAQGCVGVQCRANDEELIKQLNSLEDTATMLSIFAERTTNEALGGSCQAPIAVHGTWQTTTQLHLEGMAANLTGTVIRHSVEAEVTQTRDARALGLQLSEAMLKQGAGALLQQTSG